MLYSTAGQVIWEVGELDSKELFFHPQKRGVLDHGAYYAQKTQLDAKGNRILWGWITEKRPDSELIAAGWAGCMALPRVLTLGKRDELTMQFVPQALELREKPAAQPVGDGQNSQNARSTSNVQIFGQAGELNWTTARTNCAYTLEDAGGPWLSVQLKPKNSRAAVVSINGVSMEVGLGDVHLFEFHLYVDGSVAEVLCDRQHAFTARIYREAHGPLRFRTNDDTLSSASGFRAWQLKPISKDRLTT